MLLFVIIVLAIVVAHALISELNRPRATVEVLHGNV